jgi:hypothetical protein
VRTASAVLPLLAIKPHCSIQTYTRVLCRLRNSAPLPLDQSMDYHIGRAVAKPFVSLYRSTKSSFILREWVHQLQRLGRGGVDRGRGCQDTGWRTRIKGGGCGWFVDGLCASAKVILVMGIQVAFLAVWSDWPPCFSVAKDAICYRLPAVVGAKWACDVPAGNRHEL